MWRAPTGPWAGVCWSPPRRNLLPARTAYPPVAPLPAAPGSWHLPPWAWWAAVSAIVLLGVWLRLLDLDQIPLVGDELEDLAIVDGMQRVPNPFAEGAAGRIALDQSRLPHQLTALTSWATGLPSLVIGRLLSVGGALLTLLVLAGWAREFFGTRVALLACALQAVSAYDIGFSHFAMTTSSSLFVALTVLALWCFSRAVTSREIRWVYAAGVAAGWSVAAKLLGVLTCLVLAGWLVVEGLRHRAVLRPQRDLTRTWLRVQVTLLGSLGVVALVRFPPDVELTAWALLMAHAVGWHLWLFRRDEGRVEDEPGVLLAGLLLSVALVYFFAGSPAHLDIGRLAGILRWFPRWYDSGLIEATPWAMPWVWFVRLNPPWNLLAIAALGAAARRRHEPVMRLLLLTVLVPLAAFSVSRWQLTWYPLMVLPATYLLIAVFVDRLWQGARRRRVLVGAALVVAFAWQAIHLGRLHPLYELDGYRLGRSAVGLNRPAMLTTEGLPDIVAWLDQRAPAGSRMAILVWNRPAYSRYVVRHIQRYTRNPGVSYVAAETLEDALQSPIIVTSLYAESLEPLLTGHGYVPARTFRVRGIRYAVVYARPDLTDALGRQDGD